MTFSYQREKLAYLIARRLGQRREMVNTVEDVSEVDAFKTWNLGNK
jgi:hypothetical protein